MIQPPSARGSEAHAENEDGSGEILRKQPLLFEPEFLHEKQSMQVLVIDSFQVLRGFDIAVNQIFLWGSVNLRENATF